MRIASRVNWSSRTPLRCGGPSPAAAYSGQSAPNQNAAAARCTSSSGASTNQSGWIDVWPPNANDASASAAPMPAPIVFSFVARSRESASNASPTTRAMFAGPELDCSSSASSDGSNVEPKLPAMYAGVST